MGSFLRSFWAIYGLVILLLFPFFGYSQKKTVRLSIDSTAALQQIQLLVDSLQSEGYLEAGLDSWSYQKTDQVAVLRLHQGPRYEWFQLDLQQLPEPMRQIAERQSRNWTTNPVQVADWLTLKEQLLAYAENNGYPFARLRLQFSFTEKNQASATVQFVAGSSILLDSLKIVGNARLAPYYLQSYLGLRPGIPFNQQTLESAEDRLRELPFVKIDQPAALRFSEQRAQPIFYLSDQAASRFDFIIGILPNSQQTSRLLVTADLEAELQNAFGKGERIYGHFEQLRPATQELELAINYPYLLQLPFGASLDFGLYKRDSSFLDLEWELGIQYLMRGGNYLQFFWRQEQSNLLEVDTRQIEQNQQLPERLDLRQTLFGISYAWQNLDYRFNPRRGWQIEARAAAGNKRIRRNAAIEEIGFGYLYDSLDLEQLQFRLELSMARHWPLFQNSTLRLATTGGWLFSEAKIYQNEQFRLGGNQLLRGFDEEFFFAQQYLVGTLEYRLLISQNSFLFAFFDGSYLQAEQAIQYPFGFGAGISLETRSGVFGLSLAYGKNDAAPIDLTSPKVHFGYISLF